MIPLSCVEGIQGSRGAEAACYTVFIVNSGIEDTKNFYIKLGFQTMQIIATQSFTTREERESNALRSERLHCHC